MKIWKILHKWTIEMIDNLQWLNIVRSNRIIRLFNICVSRRTCNLSNSMQIVYRILFDFVILNSLDYDYWLIANTLIWITIVDSSECWLNLFERFIYWISKAFNSFHFFTLALRRVLKCILQDVNYELSYIIQSLFHK